MFLQSNPSAREGAGRLWKNGPGFMGGSCFLRSVTRVAELRGVAEFQSFTGFLQHGIYAALFDLGHFIHDLLPFFGIAHFSRLQE